MLRLRIVLQFTCRLLNQYSSVGYDATSRRQSFLVLILEDGTDRSSRNVAMEFPFYAAKIPEEGRSHIGAGASNHTFFGLLLTEEAKFQSILRLSALKGQTRVSSDFVVILNGYIGYK